jgi:hypothetical protein
MVGLRRAASTKGALSRRSPDRLGGSRRTQCRLAGATSTVSRPERALRTTALWRDPSVHLSTPAAATPKAATAPHEQALRAHGSVDDRPSEVSRRRGQHPGEPPIGPSRNPSPKGLRKPDTTATAARSSPHRSQRTSRVRAAHACSTDGGTPSSRIHQGRPLSPLTRSARWLMPHTVPARGCHVHGEPPRTRAPNDGPVA